MAKTHEFIDYHDKLDDAETRFADDHPNATLTERWAYGRQVVGEHPRFEEDCDECNPPMQDLLASMAAHPSGKGR